MAARVRCVNARESVAASLDELGALQFFSMPRHAGIGAGEGNRTLVVSLEGFCSTIELHPLAGRQCHCRARCVNRPKRLTNPKPLPYHAIRMTHLVAIAAISNSRLWWWQSASLAARWRD